MKAKEARMAAVIEDYNEGLTVKEIMDKHDLSYKTVKEYLRLYKMENESDYHRKKTEESEERARVMAGEFANGMTTQEIADRHGVDKTSVMLALRLNRTANADPDALYRRLMCTAKTKRYIRDWAGREARHEDEVLLSLVREELLEAFAKGNRQARSRQADELPQLCRLREVREEDEYNLIHKPLGGAAVH